MMTKRLKKNDAILVVIDFQEKLMPAMYDRNDVEDKTSRMIRGAKALGLPVVVTQQYTRGLGETVPVVAEALGEYEPIDKVTFSCCGNEEFLAAVNKAKEEGRNAVIITGCETHICVEQTALDLLEMGFDVFLAADCVQSRTRENREISLRRMEKAGIVVSSYESMLYDMLESAKAPEFKAISAIVK